MGKFRRMFARGLCKARGHVALHIGGARGHKDTVGFSATRVVQTVKDARQVSPVWCFRCRRPLEQRPRKGEPVWVAKPGNFTGPFMSGFECNRKKVKP